MDYTDKKVVLSNATEASPQEAKIIKAFELEGAEGVCVSDTGTYLRVYFPGVIALDLAKNLFTLAE